MKHGGVFAILFMHRPVGPGSRLVDVIVVTMSEREDSTSLREVV